ncbi:hypothetical protein L6164_023973 [Bauhinia variegata]|uniref:Uncharacterized protein n=1 Tax=Bauhinia variegata TaxID=167791 RepID=A0ACB9LYF5_BAUVA|nr:hypothetical protein L6164_023973 [Bauhinia variegata]
MCKEGIDQNKSKYLQFTKKNGKFSLRHREWIWRTQSGVDDESSIDSGSEKVSMSMPPECPLLVNDTIAVCVTSPRLDGALSYISRSICPWISQHSQAMPD